MMVAFWHLKNFHIDRIYMLTLKILWAIVAKSNANVIVSAVKLHSIVSYLLVIFVIPHCFTQSTICSIIHITYSKGQNFDERLVCDPIFKWNNFQCLFTFQHSGFIKLVFGSCLPPPPPRGSVSCSHGQEEDHHRHRHRGDIYIISTHSVSTLHLHCIIHYIYNIQGHSVRTFSVRGL